MSPNCMFYCGFMYWSNISFISYCLYESEPCLRRWQLQRCKVSLEYILLILAVFQGFICHFLYTTHSFNSIMNILLILIKTLCNKYYYYCHYTSWDDWDRLITLLTLLVNSKNKKMNQRQLLALQLYSHPLCFLLPTRLFITGNTYSFHESHFK